MFEKLCLFKNESKDRDVFDVISTKANAHKKDLLMTIPKIASIFLRLSKIKREGEDTSIIEHDLLEIVKKLLPVIVDSAHYSYEVYKEIEYYYGNEKLLEYVQNSGKDPISFAYNYNENKKMIKKLLSLFAILKSEGMTINDFNDPSVALRVINGENEMDIIASKFDRLSDKAKGFIDEVLDKDVKYEELSPEIHSLTEKYHFVYMTENIYPYVNENVNERDNEEKVLHLASKLGNKRKKSF